MRLQGYESEYSLQINIWLDFMKPKYLKIKDIEKLKSGDKIKILCIDRNFFDFLFPNKYTVIPTKACELFKNNYIIEYTHKKGLRGTVKWLNFHSEDMDFEFDIEFSENIWHPLIDGMLPVSLDKVFKIDKVIEKNWQLYDKNTHVGWRGPMLLWKDVLNSPMIYY